VELRRPGRQRGARFGHGPRDGHRVGAARCCSSGNAVSLSARVVAPRTPHGTVQFFDGDKPIGEAVDLVDGRASLTHSFSGTGSHTIVANTAVQRDSSNRPRSRECS
ncbi:hypothetical protein GS439_12585, partial [Rhodococcus hoagii]|nr:hypothetical protein [Prescottella equi]